MLLSFHMTCPNGIISEPKCTYLLLASKTLSSCYCYCYCSCSYSDIHLECCINTHTLLAFPFYPTFFGWPFIFIHCIWMEKSGEKWYAFHNRFLMTVQTDSLPFWTIQTLLKVDYRRAGEMKKKTHDNKKWSPCHIGRNRRIVILIPLKY